MSRIAVVGSTNLDLVAVSDHLPAPGETVVNAELSRHRGGKGANQALAAARYGADVAFVAATGADPEADFALALLAEAGVDLSGVVRLPDVPTGIALIMVDRNGENQISVASGANGHLAPSHVSVAGVDAVLCQLEVPLETVAEAVRQSTGLVVLNAAPARPLPAGLLDGVDVVIVNEGEHRDLATDLQQFGGLVVRTLGPAGAEAIRGGSVVAATPAPAVDAIDAVGAGDAFCGVLTAAMADGVSLEAALRLGCAAGAAAATGSGVQSSIPTKSAIEALL